jgi:hypothetical protein
MPNFLAQQQGGKKTTQVHNHRISTLLLYLFNIRKVFLGVTSKSSTAFFTVWGLKEYKWKGSFLPLLVPWTRHAGKIDFCSVLAALGGPVQIFFPRRTLFQCLCPHRPANWVGRRAGSPVSVSLVFAVRYVDAVWFTGNGKSGVGKGTCTLIKNWENFLLFTENQMAKYNQGLGAKSDMTNGFLIYD